MSPNAARLFAKKLTVERTLLAGFLRNGWIWAREAQQASNPNLLRQATRRLKSEYVNDDTNAVDPSGLRQAASSRLPFAS